ncbi:MAG: ferritin-like domain-containing protein [Deltaproteobacteria bacterium]
MGYIFSSYQIADLAAHLEAEGAAYYKGVAARMDDADLRAVFSRLAQMELEHRMFFHALARQMEDGAAPQEYVVDVEGILRTEVEKIRRAFIDASSLAAGTMRPRDALAVAISLEETSICVYSAIREKFSERFSGALDRILAEEKEHLKIFERAKGRT